MTDEEIARAYQVPQNEVTSCREAFVENAGPDMIAAARERVKNRLALAAPEALDTIEGVMRTSESEGRRMKAADSILDRAGFKAPERVAHTVQGVISHQIHQRIKNVFR